MELIIVIILTLLYIIAGLFTIRHSYFVIKKIDWLLLWSIIFGLIPMLFVIYSTLNKYSLRFYITVMRFINKIKNLTVRWSLYVRYEGKFNNNIVLEFSDFLTSQKIKYPIKIFHKTNQSINFLVNNFLNLYLDYENAEFTNQDRDYINVKFSDFEIGCRDSEKKIAERIIPLLTKFEDFFKPENKSYTLNINFIDKNPFYSIYLQHIDENKIKNFGIELVLGNYVAAEKEEKVSIYKDYVSITALSLSSLRELAKDFIFISANKKTIQE
jgi:hypothetical protein